MKFLSSYYIPPCFPFYVLDIWWQYSTPQAFILPSTHTPSVYGFFCTASCFHLQLTLLLLSLHLVPCNSSTFLWCWEFLFKGISNIMLWSKIGLFFRYNSLIERIKHFLEVICPYFKCTFLMCYDFMFIVTKIFSWLKTQISCIPLSNLYKSWWQNLSSNCSNLCSSYYFFLLLQINFASFLPF